MNLSTSLGLTIVERAWLLRNLRAIQIRLREDMLRIEAQLKGGGNGSLTTEYRLLDGDNVICDTIIRKLWIAA